MDEISTRERRKREHDLSGDSKPIPVDDLLAKTKYVDFYKAMSNNDYTMSTLSVEEYATVMVEFKKRMGLKLGPLEKQIDDINVQVTILANCLIYFPILGCKDEDAEILRALGVEVSGDLQNIVDNVQKMLNKKSVKGKLLSGELPKAPKMDKITGEDMLAELSLGIEMRLSMDCSLLEYMSYYKAAKKRSAAQTKQNKKNK